MGFRDALSNVGSKIAFHEFFEDFNEYSAADWVITTTEAGVGSATEALADEQFGALLITNDAADNDADFFQSVAENFKFVAGKRLYFGIRFKTSDATQSDIVAGLQIRDTAPLAVSDGIWFGKDDGDTNIDFHVAKNSTQTDELAVGTLADATYMQLEFYYDGSTDEAGLATTQQIMVFVDGVRVAGVALTNVVDDTELAVSFGIQNGEAVAKTLTVDWVRAFQER